MGAPAFTLTLLNATSFGRWSSTSPTTREVISNTLIAFGECHGNPKAPVVGASPRIGVGGLACGWQHAIGLLLRLEDTTSAAYVHVYESFVYLL
jgi:hypothetical protein